MKNNSLPKWPVIVAIVLAGINLLAGLSAYSQEGGTPITVTGRLQVRIIENFNQNTATTAYLLEADHGPVYELQFSNSPPENLHTGQAATVQGMVEDNQLRVDAITLQVPELVMTMPPDSAIGSDAAMPQAPTTDKRRAVILLVDLQDARTPASYTLQYFADLMYSSTPPSVRDLYLQNSFGQIDFVADGNGDGPPDVFGPFLINDSYSPTNACNYSNWALAAEAAAQSANINLSIYQHRIFVLPPPSTIPSCQWAGSADTGCASGYPCRLWIIEAMEPMVYVHELGHNLGLAHAGTDPDNNGYIEVVDQYADSSDPMGNSLNWHLFSAPNMNKMGWYANHSGGIATVTGSGDYTLDVLDATLPVDPLTPRIIRLYWPRNKLGYYYLSYRQPAGYDTSLATTYTQGVNIHWSEGAMTQTHPTAFVKSLSDTDPTFIDSVAGIQVTQISHGTDYATVSIVQPANRPPVVTITTPSIYHAGYYPNEEITFNGTAIDIEDGDLTAGLTWTSNLIGVIGTGGTFTRMLPIGNHTLEARVVDSGGLSRSVTFTVAVQPNSAPWVEMYAPTNGATFTTEQAIAFSASAYDIHDGELGFYLNWTSSRDGPLGIGTSFVRTLSAGVHTIQAQVTDSTGLVGSAAVTITVQGNTAPTVTVTAPTDGATLTTDQIITFTGTATDAQDGNLTASLSWTSSIDGTLGSGGSFNRALSLGDHTIQASVTDSKGVISTATLTVHVIRSTTTTITSVGAEDGWVLESSENSNVGGSIKSSDTSSKALLLGDSSRKQQYKSILSFDTASLPDNAIITSATLKLQRGTLSGVCPFDTHGVLWANITNGTFNNNAALETTDFQAPATATRVVTLSTAASNGAWSQGKLSTAGLTALNTTGRTQFRLYFNLDDDNDSVTDYLGYYAGEYGTVASRPQLEVNYVVNFVPVVTITAPANGTQVMPHTLIEFRGVASDVEDHSLNDRMVWTSDLDGVIGTGSIVTTDKLREGIHTITASVTDGFGAQAAASITLINSADHAPTVTIHSPVNGASFIDGDVITFTGTANDAEDGNITSNLIWTSSINGSIGSGGSFSRTLSAGTHTIQAQATDSGGFSGKATLTITVAPPPTTTFTSVGGEDGWVLESSETSNVGGSIKASDTSSKGLLLGDNRSNYQYKSILSFDTASLPDNATIMSATLRLQRGTLSGTSPFDTHGALLVDIRNGAFNNNAALETADFQAAPATAVGVASLTNATSNGAWSEGAINVNGLAAINKTGRTQFRLYFSLDDNNDKGEDSLGYYAGEYSVAASRPQLVVTYR